MMVLLPLVKGAVMAAVVTALGTTFFQGLVITIVSASISGIFLLLANVMVIRAARENRHLLHDIKRKVGANRRDEDDG